MLQLYPFPVRITLITASCNTQTHKFLNSKNPKSHPRKSSKLITQNHIFHSTHKNKTNLIHKPNNGSQETQQIKFNTISEFNDQLMALVDSNEFELVSNLFTNCDLEPDCSTYSIMIQCYCKSREPIEAKRIAHHMLDKSCQPNVATLTMLVNEFCSGGRVGEAREIIKMMRRINRKPTIQTYNCLLKGLCYVGKVEEAYELMINLKIKSFVEPDIFTYSAIMDGFCKVGRSNEALELLEEALKSGLVPNVATYNTILNGYFKEGKPLEGIGLIEKMKKRGCTPDYTAYSTLLHGLLKWGEIGEALGVYKEMVCLGYRVDERMMNTLLRGLIRRSRREKVVLSDAYEVFERMKLWEIIVNDITFDLVIEAFCRGGKIDEALVNLDRMIEFGYDPKEITFENVIRKLCDEGRVEEALRVLVMYHERGSLSIDSFKIVIDELNFQGKLFGSSVVYGLGLKLGLIL